ncbi:peptide/nickel transport system substrate-binding protein [Friedmanniella luteola]|uniref:Peptide/nickel transport system substrate-binding protein n=1 Tax=Friedmanniella luteola TaxID=546871 RepID=A0A1H1U7N8_9ACTN|nr:ABC transporter substrate-binding protein [Friedmanniella luteola]SDS68522.1 peptide/nickel transport system substrate-binding protein [Friedmanniella luteola]
MTRPERRTRALATLAAAGVLLTGCSLTGRGPEPTPTGSPTARPFTVMSTDAVRVTDPAAMTDASSAMLALNVFQRLMTAAPGESVLKPDAARDCIFTAATTYTCTLNEDETFHNGHALTSSDVKFSVERAARLNVAGSSAPLLSSLRRIETPDPLTVRFLLSRVDTQFGWALASPAASIVDEEVYDADKVRPTDEPVVGSGPFSVTSFADDEIALQRFPDYQGRNPAAIDNLVYRSAPDSAAIEDAMARNTVDLVWRGLDEAAVTRLSQQANNADDTTATGFQQQVLTGTRVLQLEWSPESRSRRNKALRTAIALALQGDRTSDSVVPGGVPGHVATFPLGGTTDPEVTWDNRINLTLGYDSTQPNGRDIATQIRSRLEDTGGLSVQLRADEPADLTLVDRKAWTATALAWLQPYVEAPLPGTAAAVATAASTFRKVPPTDEATADQLLATLQKQAATDLVVLPVSQSDEYVYVGPGADLAETSYGPGWQLGLFGISRG